MQTIETFKQGLAGANIKYTETRHTVKQSDSPSVFEYITLQIRSEQFRTVEFIFNADGSLTAVSTPK